MERSDELRELMLGFYDALGDGDGVREPSLFTRSLRARSGLIRRNGGPGREWSRCSCNSSTPWTAGCRFGRARGVCPDLAIEIGGSLCTVRAVVSRPMRLRSSGTAWVK